MRLQKTSSRKIGEKQYFKYIVILSPTIVKDLGWEEGVELKAIKKDKSILLIKQGDE